MLFRWLRDRRRRKLLAQPFPAEWKRILESNLWQYRCLTESDQAKLRDLVRIFVAEKNWEGCAGLELTDEIRVTVAANACLIILHIDLGIDPYRQVISVLVYPDEFTVPEEPAHHLQLTEEGPDERIGEAWQDGAVVVSWADVRDCADRRSAGVNVVVHEFAHELDAINRIWDGTPPLREPGDVAVWKKTMKAEYEFLARQVEADRHTLLDPAGADDTTEFFAIASETFFEKPGQLRRERPALYAVLKQFYGQDPAELQAQARKAWKREQTSDDT